MESKEIGPSNPAATSIACIHLSIKMVPNIITWVDVCRVFQKCRDNLVPSFSDRYSNQSKDGCKEVVETDVVIIYNIVLFDMFKDLHTNGCVEEDKGTD